MKTMKRFNNRRAVAPIEFVMILPIWVLMLMLIIYIGSGAIRTLTLVNETHWEAWKQRDHQKPANVTPMDFEDVQGKLEAKNETIVKGGGIFDRWKHKTSNKQALYVGSWDGESCKKYGYGSGSNAKIYKRQIEGKLKRNDTMHLSGATIKNPRVNVPVGKSSEADD